MDRVVIPLKQMGAEMWGRAWDTLPPLVVRVDLEALVVQRATERLLQAWGQVVAPDGREVTLVPAGALRTNRISVSGDFSSAAFFLVAGLILPDSDLTIEGVGVNPTRTGLLDALQAMGGVVEVQQEEEDHGTLCYHET